MARGIPSNCERLFIFITIEQEVVPPGGIQNFVCWAIPVASHPGRAARGAQFLSIQRTAVKLPSRTQADSLLVFSTTIFSP